MSVGITSEFGAGARIEGDCAVLLEARDQCRASSRMRLVVPGPRNVQRALAALELESEFAFVDAPPA